MWKFIQKELGYSAKEMQQFQANPRNREVLAKAPEIRSKTIVAEITHSKGCASRLCVGDKLYFDGSGNLLTGLSPKKVCLYALNAVVPQIFCVNELLCAGIDPNEMKFKRAACFDVGLECGGWGQVVMEIRVENRNQP